MRGRRRGSVTSRPARHPERAAGPCLAAGDWWMVVLGAALLAALTGCQEHEFEPPDRAEQVTEADSIYLAELFDTVTWAADSIRALEGNIVFAAKCRQCHGPLGGGDTPYARERELEVPSLVRPDWELAGDVEAIRRRIFAGHEAGMPTWGVAGISPREIDAATHYIVDVLRPEVLGTADGEGGA